MFIIIAHIHSPHDNNGHDIGSVDSCDVFLEGKQMMTRRLYQLAIQIFYRPIEVARSRPVNNNDESAIDNCFIKNPGQEDQTHQLYCPHPVRHSPRGSSEVQGRPTSRS